MMTAGHRKPWPGRLLVGAASCVAVVLAATQVWAQDDDVVDVSEVEGAQAVAIALSQRTFEAADAVVVGRDDVFADALASGVLQSDRPLLLTRSDRLATPVAAEIQRLGATRATLLGGTAALSASVAADLEGLGLVVDRLHGPSRVETAADVAAAAPAATTALLVRAFATDDPTQAFADSLAVGGWAAGSGVPVLLTASQTLSPATAEALVDGDYAEVVIVGGEAAIGTQVAADVEALGLTVRRVSGLTRSDTAVAVAQERGFAGGRDAATVLLVESRTVDAWAAGFAGAAASGVWDAPIVLAEDGVLADVTADWLAAGGTTGFTQTTTPPRLLCAATSDVCAQAAGLLGIQEDPPPPGPLTVTFDVDGMIVHRNTPIIGQVTGGEQQPEEVTVAGPCIAGSPATVPVMADGTIHTTVSADSGSMLSCTLTGTVDGDQVGQASVQVQVFRLATQGEGDFNRPGVPFDVQVLDVTDDTNHNDLVAALTLDGPCIEPDSQLVDGGTLQGRWDTSYQGWCAVDATATFADGGFQTFSGPEVPNTYACEGQMVTHYDRATQRIELVTDDGTRINRPYDTADLWSVDGQGAVTLAAFADALSHGDCLQALDTSSGDEILLLTNVATGCPDTFWQTGSVGYDDVAGRGHYTEDAGGVRDASQLWRFEEGDTFVVDDAQTTLSAFGTQLGRHDCVRLEVDGATQHLTHRLVNRDWRGP